MKKKDADMIAKKADLRLQLNEPRHVKTGLRDFRPGSTQIGLYSH